MKLRSFAPRPSCVALALALAALPIVSACSSEPSSLSSPAAGATGEAREAIIGGVPDEGAGAHESVVMLSLGQAICSGTLIAKNVVLTARHCVSQNVSEGLGCDSEGNSLNGDQVGADLAPGKIDVLLGSSPSPWDPPAAYNTATVHSEGKVLCNHDIALIVLNQPIEGLTPVPVRLDFGPQIGELTTVVGYGKTTSDDFSAGQRHRRENVPVVSVGKDWNFLTGDNEFVLGQSTCQGDSGGPVLAQDTGAVLGVTSRGGDCFTSHQYFTRLDAHKDLVMTALAMAGSTVVPEGKAAPTPATPIATGDGPCSTGAECSQNLCFGPAGATYCSSLCQPGFCQGGLVCQPQEYMVDGKDLGLQPICTKHEAVTACDGCRYSKCKSLLEQCINDEKCAPYAACVSACADSACVDACTAKNPSGASLYQKAHDCECSSKCAKSCADYCGGDPGAGGSSGAGGSGDAGGGSGEGGSGEGGSGAGTAGAGASGKAGGAGSTGLPSAGSAGASGAAGTSPTGAPAAQPVDDSGSSGGCSSSGAPSPSGGWFLLAAAAALAAKRRRSLPPVETGG